MPETDKIGHGYDPMYRRVTAAVLLNSLYPNVLEVGVADGAGLHYFRKLMPSARLFGLDHNTRLKNPYGPMVYANQNDEYLAGHVRTLMQIEGIDCFDLIVDDGQHEPVPTRNTFYQLWPLVRPGGWYVIEDWTHANGIGLGFIAEIPGIITNGLGSWRWPTADGLSRIESAELYANGLCMLNKKWDDQ